jgi:outer membrane protein TolC
VKSNTTSPITHKNTTLKVNEITISPNWMVGAALKWEIFSGFERSHKIHEAKLNMQQTQNQIQDTKEKLQLLLENNLVNYTMANQKIDIVAQQEKIAQNNNTMAIKQYKEGLINISERLQAENDWYKIGVTKISTIIEQRLSAMETIITTGELSKYTVK